MQALINSAAFSEHFLLFGLQFKEYKNVVKLNMESIKPMERTRPKEQVSFWREKPKCNKNLH